MAYSSSTSQALYGNLSRLAQSVIPMFDPQVAAQAETHRMNRELFPLKRRGLELDNDLTAARTTTEGAQAGLYRSQGGFYDSKTDYQRGQNAAQQMLLQGGPLPSAPSGPLSVPTTHYSTGAAVGGPDEMQDSWTNKGYSATGKNLTPGIVAVNPSRYGMGTVFRDSNTGEVFVAGDKHGNGNPDVVDIYQEPAAYTAANGRRNLQVVGKEKLPYGTTAEQINEIRQKYALPANTTTKAGDVLPDMEDPAIRSAIPQRRAEIAALAGINPEQYVGGLSRAEALHGGFSEERGRELALAQGILPSQTTAITPGYQTDRDRALAADEYRQAADVARINQAGDFAIADQNNRFGLMGDIVLSQLPGAGRRASSSGGSMPLMPGAPRTFGDMQKLEEEAAAASFQTFGVPMTEEGAPENDPFTPQRRAWQQSYIELRKQGLTRADAAARANVHHFGTATPTISSKDGWFSDPSIPQMQPEPVAPPQMSPGGVASTIDIPALIASAAQAVGLGGETQQAPMPTTGYGNRPDGTPKGKGWLGEIPLSDGGVATEYTTQSNAVKQNGQRIDFPVLVPTLTQQEVDLLRGDIIPNRKPIPELIMQKAIKFANERIASGESVFAGESPIPATKPAPVGRALGEEKEKKANADKAAVGSKYNEGTLNKLVEAAQRNGVSIEDIAATAFGAGKANEKELSRVTRVVNENPGLLEGVSSTLRPEDIRNALLDAAAMQRVGIDPAVIRQYIPGANAPANLDDEVAARASKYLTR